MQRVLVIDKLKQPLMPCHPARARRLLKTGKAAVYRRYPFTIILKEREGGEVQPVAFKVDPGAKTTGLALVADTDRRGKRVVWAGELTHRGFVITESLKSRAAVRRSRRQRKTRYRPARWMNRSRVKYWLPPSLQSRIENVMTWGMRLSRFAPLTSVSMELVKFDTQKMRDPEISGVEYQQGELAGYEVREYLLEKWGRKCAYCGAKNVPLQIEHINPRSRGGSNQVSNLTLACQPCNQKKGNRTAAEFGFPDIQAQAKRPLKDAAAVNVTRKALWYRLVNAGLPVETGTGARTKFNRTKQGYPKAHWIDAACVGESGTCVYVPRTMKPLLIKATGHGRRQMCITDKYGFPKRHKTRNKRAFGFRTGDVVRAEFRQGDKRVGKVGRVVVKQRGDFRVLGKSISYKYCTMVHRADGYDYFSETVTQSESE